MEITENMIVLGKIIGYPKWPCVVTKIKKSDDSNNDEYLVKFFTDGSIAFLKRKDISNYEQNVDILKSKNRSNKSLIRAIEAADFQLKIKSKYPDYSIVVSKKRICSSDRTQSQAVITKKIKRNNLTNIIPVTENYEIENNRTIGLITDDDCYSAGILKNLLLAGYSLFIFDAVKYGLQKKYQDCGKLCSYPNIRGVVKKASMIILCVANEERLKRIIYTEVLSEDLIDKEILMMSNITPESSIHYYNTFKKKGAKYLEVLIQGSRTKAFEGTLTFITAGNLDFFNEILFLLKIIGSYVYHFEQVGNAIKVHLILQIFKGLNLIALAAGKSLLKSLKIPPQILQVILINSPLYSEYLKVKNEFNANKNDLSEEPVEYMEKDLEMCIDMASKVNHSLNFLGAIKDLFKLCQTYKLGIGHDDTVVTALKPNDF